MKYRPLGRTGWNVSEISFGAWAIGHAWGRVDDSESMAALHRAVDLGVNFIDTADVYGAGKSERLIGELLKERRETIYVATKMGRRLSPHTAAGYNAANFAGFVEDSLRNLQVDALDLIQLHCPPTESYRMPETFDALDGLVRQGKIRYYGVSVETIEEALLAIEYPNVQSVQIIFNIFRPRPAEVFFPKAKERGVGILARVPLASGLLSGKMSASSVFPENDHRNFNRYGKSFDVGETFSGVDFEEGLRAVEEIKAILPPGCTLPQLALRWILMYDAVSCAIPGAKRPAQVEDNMAASGLPPLSETQMKTLAGIYDRRFRAQVHTRW
ncbi:MAG TPA: aldo/keto reductase [Bryobacteraceae bacterium]|nr:aldo/keto reductase [Bryobacteraceae bacterium]